MSNQGRFGKYGEIKRLNCMRKAGLRTSLRNNRAFQRFQQVVPFEKSENSIIKIKIHMAKPSDSEFVSALSDKVFGVYGPYREIIASWFESEITSTFVARLGKQPVGFAMLGFLSTEGFRAELAELLAIAIEPQRQRQGIGQRLLAAIGKRAEELKIKKISLHTAIENLGAQELFRRHGFISAGVKNRFYPAGQAALMMIKKFDR